MIELKSAQKAAAGGRVAGAFCITGEDALLLPKCREVAVELKALISHAKSRHPSKSVAGLPGFGAAAGLSGNGESVQNSQEQESAARIGLLAIPIVQLHSEKKSFEKSSSGNFEFALPNGLPATYYGKLIDVRWMVAVKIDMPLAMDKGASCEIVVE